MVTNWEDPPLPVAVIVTFPVAEFTDIPEPAVIEVTPAPVRVDPPRTIDVALILPVEPLIVIPEPTLIIFEIPLRVILAGPIVTIPVTLASPFTKSVVPDAPTAPTSNLNLGFVVPIPTFLRVWIPADVDTQVPPIAVKLVPSPKRL